MRISILSKWFNQVGKMDRRFIESENEFKLYQAILNDLEIQLTPSSMILEFGCGSGGMVYQLRKRGFKAFGVDIVKVYSEAEQLCNEEKLNDGKEKIFRYLDMSNYKIPFEDNTFDFVFSDQVMEHVQNFEEAVEEIYRVLKPGGCSLHFFPPRYRFLEGHVYVPFAGVFQNYNYLLFWAFLGIRNEAQKGLNFREVARLNAEYLKKGTNYPSPARIRTYFARFFQKVEYREDVSVKNSTGNSRHIYFLIKLVPLVRWVFRNFHEQVIFVRKPINS